MTLECTRRNVKVAVRNYFEKDSRIAYDGNLATLRFESFTTIGSSNLPFVLTLRTPDGSKDEVQFRISAKKTVADTAYLFERELCTPGVIEVEITE